MTGVLTDREYALVAELSRVLDEAGYTEKEVKAAIGVTGELLISTAHLSRYRHSLVTDGPLRDIVRLFVLAEPLPRSLAAAAFAPVDLRSLEELGLLECERDRVRPLVHVVPFRHVRLVHDFDAAELQQDHVSGVSRSSALLETLTVRKRVELTLDVGSGCGVQALLAAQHSARVIATDLNPRAVRFTELSARLSGIDNVDVRQGDGFEPARESSFDLILSNLPYVLSPDRSYLFRDSGAPGDAMSQSAVLSAAALLREGGIAEIMSNWIDAEKDWSARPRRWLEGAGCDAWLLHAHSEDALTYAASFLRPLGVRDPKYPAALDRWVDYYRKAGIEKIASGVVILRRRAASNWTRADEMPLPSAAASEHILRVFAAEDDLRTLDQDSDLLDSAFRLVEPHRLEQTLYFRDAHYETPPARLVLQNGVGVVGEVPSSHLVVLFHLDGTRALRQVVSDVAGQIGVDTDKAVFDILRTVRRLYQLGIVVRTSPQAQP